MVSPSTLALAGPAAKRPIVAAAARTLVTDFMLVIAGSSLAVGESVFMFRPFAPRRRPGTALLASSYQTRCARQVPRGAASEWKAACWLWALRRAAVLWLTFDSPASAELRHARIGKKSMPDTLAKLRNALESRFADPPQVLASGEGMETLAGMAARGARRDFTAQPVGGDLVRLLCAVALSSPTKSDLQQRDILRVSDPELRRAVNAAGRRPGLDRGSAGAADLLRQQPAPAPDPRLARPALRQRPPGCLLQRRG